MFFSCHWDFINFYMQSLFRSSRYCGERGQCQYHLEDVEWLQRERQNGYARVFLGIIHLLSYQKTLPLRYVYVTKMTRFLFHVRICKLHNHTIFHVSHFRYIMNVHGVAEGSLCHQDTTPRERNASNALFVQFSFPQTSLSSTPIVCWLILTNTYSPMPQILILGEGIRNSLEIHQR